MSRNINKFWLIGLRRIVRTLYSVNMEFKMDRTIGGKRGKVTRKSVQKEMVTLCSVLCRVSVLSVKVNLTII